MTAMAAALTEQYTAALASYLARRDETTLSSAYELGRRAMIEGLGVLEVASLHRSALRALVLPVPPNAQEATCEAAEDFYAELLSPFEMSLRGYRVANENLRSLNETLRQQKQAIEIANKELESFSYSVSHDLRAPLRSIDGFSQALIEDYEAVLDEDGKRCLRHVREATQQMGQLIDDLLGLARVTRTELRRADVDVTALVRRVFGRLQAAAPERKATLTVQEGVRAFCDSSLLGILLDNLLGNAWKFTSHRPQAEIAFASERRGGETVYSVQDNGAGFDMKYASKLFGAFQRLHAASEFEGTGIGLATVKRIVDRHGGRVWAEGRVGQGASFFFTLGEETGER
jgi:light-regulated signal transduction histidine kinase (bacteriophytochrome)